ncbi:cell division protein ftsq [hydrocarbon metagenome]|uniref:Cell division protein ftsq n=1 Tax=hydrocarbon metagenome TaxID=938273 RepID=A0A0W8E4I3_9ZZZZ
MTKYRSRRIFHISILFFITLICVFFFLYSSFFYIDTISVSGNERVEESEVLKLSGVTKGTNIFKLDNRLCARAVETHPIIKTAQITRQLPREIKINIVEREMWAVMPYNDVFLVLDPEGVCLDKMAYIPEGDYCLITMDNPPEQITLGHAVASTEIEMIRKVYELIPEEVENNLSQFHYDTIKEEILIYTLRGTEIKFGNLDRIEEKTELIAQVFPMEIDLEENGTGKLEYIDLRFTGQPVLKMK